MALQFLLHLNINPWFLTKRVQSLVPATTYFQTMTLDINRAYNCTNNVTSFYICHKYYVGPLDLV